MHSPGAPGEVAGAPAGRGDAAGPSVGRDRARERLPLGVSTTMAREGIKAELGCARVFVLRASNYLYGYACDISERGVHTCTSMYVHAA